MINESEAVDATDCLVGEHFDLIGGLSMDFGSFMIPIITFCVGFFISEITRRLNRAETINVQIFNRRLEVYSELYVILNNTYNDISAFVELLNDESSPNIDNNDVLSYHWEAIVPLLKYLDNNALFISEELTVQCGAVFAPLDDFSEKGISDYLINLSEGYKAISFMIKSESGLNKLNKNLKRILGYRHKSEIISYYHKLKKEYDSKKK